MLATAMMDTQDARGYLGYLCRAFFDGGFQSHFITQELCDKINLKLSYLKLSLTKQLERLEQQQICLKYKKFVSSLVLIHSERKFI